MCSKDRMVRGYFFTGLQEVFFRKGLNIPMTKEMARKNHNIFSLLCLNSGNKYFNT